VVVSLCGLQDSRAIPAVRTPQLTRGARAWEVVSQGGFAGFGIEDENRLLVHSVDDNTALVVY
jgi:hypothetical protein